MKSTDKKFMAVTTSIAVLAGSVLMGGLTGFHSTEATREYLNAKSDDEVKAAEQHRRFWNVMRIAADITAACAGYASGLLIKDAFNLGKKH